MPGLMSGDWKRSTVSGPQRLQRSAWTAPDLSATAPALDSTDRGRANLLPVDGHSLELAIRAAHSEQICERRFVMTKRQWQLRERVYELRLTLQQLCCPG